MLICEYKTYNIIIQASLASVAIYRKMFILSIHYCKQNQHFLRESLKILFI